MAASANSRSTRRRRGEQDGALVPRSRRGNAGEQARRQHRPTLLRDCGQLAMRGSPRRYRHRHCALWR